MTVQMMGCISCSLVWFHSLKFCTPFATEGFVVLVLMTSWLTALDGGDHPELEILELFAGKARITRLAKQLGIPADAHDWDYDKDAIKSKGSLNNSMDITGPAGIVSLSLRFRKVLGSAIDLMITF